MPSLPYDVLYDIYFYVGDYNTAKQFWLLNKHFTYNFIQNYTQAYRHLFSILFKTVFEFLSLLPDTRFIQEDIEFLCSVESHCNRYNQNTLKHDIKFMYMLYKNFLFQQILHAHAHNRHVYTVGESLVNMCLVQGPTYLDRYCTVVFDRSRVTLVANVLLKKDKSSTYRHIDNQLHILETFLLT